MFFKVIACEIAFREICHVAARSPHLTELEFLTQGYHDIPATGKTEVQKHVDAVPAGKYDAILLGYGLCSNILAGLTARDTRIVIPRAHDCITFFLGSKERYQECFNARPGTYYYTSGWLECSLRRGGQPAFWGGASQPAGAGAGMRAAYDEWVKKYGEEQAKYLLEEVGRWSTSYSHGTLIQFEFLKDLKLDDQVRQLCAANAWEFTELKGDLGLLQRMVDGEWPAGQFLVLEPGQELAPSFDNDIITAEKPKHL